MSGENANETKYENSTAMKREIVSSDARERGTSVTQIVATRNKFQWVRHARATGVS